MMIRTGLALLIALSLVACSDADSETTADNPDPEKGRTESLEHVAHFAWISKDISRGGQPVGDAAFKELADAGIKVIINVDGARPDVETAAKYGMRYVHIPFGYDKIPEKQELELAKTVRELEGPFFVHCHHGKHRGPAGAVIAQMALGGMTNDEAVAELKRAGTADKYKGLYGCAAMFDVPDGATTEELSFDFPEIAPVPAMADAMARMDRNWDNMKAAREASFGVPEDHPDVDPPHEALQIREHLVEIGRTDEAKEKGDDFMEKLDESIAAARALESSLRKETPDAEGAEAAYRTLSQSCSKCHHDYRNN